MKYLLLVLALGLYGCEGGGDGVTWGPRGYSEEVLEIAERIGFRPKDVAKARSLSPAELQALTETYLGERHQGPSYWLLKPARDLAAPYLIAAFERDDPFKKNEGSYLLHESAATQAFHLLDRGVHPELKDHLLRWLKSGDESVLSVIDSDLTAFGTDDLLPHVKVLFEHENSSIASAARSGAMEAIRSGRAEPEFRRYVWSQAKALFENTGDARASDSISIMLGIEEEKTRRLLLDPALLHPEHPLFDTVLGTLVQLGSPPDAAFLRSLLANHTITPDHRRERVHGIALFALVSHGDPAASNHVESILAKPQEFSDSMVLTAWDARFKIRGIEPIYDSALGTYTDSEYDLNALSPEERAIVLIQALDVEVHNGGFVQWYYNRSGKHAVETRDALKIIGADDHAELVDRANRLFGRKGPPDTERKTERALDRMSERNAEAMSELTRSWFQLPYWKLHAAEWDWNRLNFPSEHRRQP